MDIHILQSVRSCGNGTMALRGRRQWLLEIDGLGRPSYKTSDFNRLLPAACCLLLLLGGCSEPSADSNGTSGESPIAGVTLRLHVVGDPEMARAVGLLRGEWHAQTGSEVQVESITEAQLADAEQLSADAVICPSHQLGVLAERGLVAPLPKEMLQDGLADWSETFELPKLREAAWGPDVMGLTFGSPVFTCYYRADLLEKLGRRPPQTWAEYEKLAAILADCNDLLDPAGSDTSEVEISEAEASASDTSASDTSASDTSAGNTEPWYGTIEPLAPGWAGLVLLARAAPYAKHRDNYSTLFDMSTMEPLIAGPPFVRALEELVATARRSRTDMLRHDPASAREAFWQGRCGMVLTWPTAATKIAHGKAIRIGIAQLPGSTEVYNVGSQSWEKRAEGEDLHVPLLTVAGRIGVVSKASAHPEHGFQLLAWLSGKQFSPQVCTGSSATTLFQRSHMESPQKWVEAPMPASAAVEYAEVTEATMLRQQWLFAPRIPGRDEYLAALDDAVGQAFDGNAPPGKLLRQTAEAWQRITERFGVEQQKAAYRHSLGLP